MASLEQRIIYPVYHVGRKSDIKHFLEDRRFLNASNEDGDWAGQGMYFWNNLSDAKYWLRGKKKRHPNVNYQVVKATFSTSPDRLLDLSNLDDVRKFEDELRQMCEVVGEPLDLEARGANINLYFRLFSNFNVLPYDAVKIIGEYPQTPSTEVLFTRHNSHNKGPHATLTTKQIIAVRNPECILERTKVNLFKG
ncbi:hypothetical protein IWT140_02306 [Secundilactobacillus pentosiphilus]|uniref:DUF3990 domain-containing protein n=1 Tax=Secundilactobacillus pentosiphilus TaxID=1714682 RepID=A0A1Z5ISB8_9LACO|nr:hypothetical protein [Secundilactobacillus pentosiphilus]GAX04663.1 hypothetical protein IWT140_02306 [Secundilactobacillus pentosiphilus]